MTTTTTDSIEYQTIAAAEKAPFVYIDSCLIQSENEEQYEGCLCSVNENCTDCLCIHRFGINYDSSGCLIDTKIGPIFECNSECLCSVKTCQNRVVQQEDQSRNAKLLSSTSKGHGVFVQEGIPRPGTYIGEYIGEVLTENQARQRIQSSSNQEHNYLLLYNEHHLHSNNYPTKTFIDARHYGNWTRFINHSCNPNLHIVPIRIDTPSPPHLAFFSLRKIQAGEELFYSYGTEIDSIQSKPCYCSSVECTGFMPYQRAD